MKQISVPDNVYKCYEELAVKLNTTVQNLIESLALEGLSSLEAQVAIFEQRVARAKANPQRIQEALDKVFEGIDPKDDIKLDPKKIKALEEQLAKDHEYNMKIYNQKHQKQVA